MKIRKTIKPYKRKGRIVKGHKKFIYKPLYATIKRGKIKVPIKSKQYKYLRWKKLPHTIVYKCNGKVKRKRVYPKKKRVRRYASQPTWEDIEDISKLEKWGRKGEKDIPVEKILGEASAATAPIDSVVSHGFDFARFNLPDKITIGGKKETTQKDIQKLLGEEGFE